VSTARWINSADRRRDPAPIKTKRRRSHPIGSGGYIHRGRNRHQSQCRSAQPMSQIVIRVVLAADPSLPVYSCKQIISEPAGTSRSANKRTPERLMHGEFELLRLGANDRQRAG